jgi:hypothetical protein
MGKVAGRTRWRVVWMMLGAGGLSSALVVFGIQQGALAASFTVSGTSHKISADNLNAQGVVLYGSADKGSGTGYPVLVVGLQNARMDNFCQSIVVPGLPLVGDITVRITTPGVSSMTADNLVLGVDDVAGDLTFSNVEIGHDSGLFDKGPSGVQGQPGAFGIQADAMQVAHLRQNDWSTTASTLRLNQVHIQVEVGHHECY